MNHKVLNVNILTPMPVEHRCALTHEIDLCLDFTLALDPIAIVKNEAMSRKCPTCEKTVYMGKHVFKTLGNSMMWPQLWSFSSVKQTTWIIFFSKYPFEWNCRYCKKDTRTRLLPCSLFSLEKHTNVSVPSCQKVTMCFSFRLLPRVCTAGEKKESLGNWYHPLCLKCKKCGRQLSSGNHAEVRTIMIIFLFWLVLKGNCKRR